MKKITSLIGILATIALTAQSVSDYKYIYIPSSSKDFQKNDYKLPQVLKAQLMSRQYIVLQDENGVLPELMATNPCSVAKAEILDDSNMMRNKVIVRFTDCQNRVLGENKGTSMEKDFDRGFPDALRISMKEMPSSNPNEANQPKAMIAAAQVAPAKVVTQQPEKITETTAPVAQSQTNTTTVKSTTAPGVQAYVFGNKEYQKVQLAADQFILVSNDSNLPFATFKNTSKADVFRVQMGDGTSTFGYLENGNLVIETTDSSGKAQNLVLKQK